MMQRPQWYELEAHYDFFEPTRTWFDRDIEIRVGLQSWCASINSITPVRQLGATTLVRVASVQHVTEGEVQMFIVTGSLPFFMVGLPVGVPTPISFTDVGAQFLTYLGYLGLFIFSNPPFNPLILRDNRTSNLLSNSKAEKRKILQEINDCLSDLGVNHLETLSDRFPDIDLNKPVKMSEWIPLTFLSTIETEQDVLSLFNDETIQIFNNRP
jgi:hypothetical protein